MKSKLTTLCYIERDDKYLLLHRIKKENDINKDKWIGVGGHFEEDEAPEECLLREVKEETGLTLKSWKLRGIITFISNEYHTEYMFLYTADDFSGDISECNEGVLVSQMSIICLFGKVIKYFLSSLKHPMSFSL